MTGNWEQVIFDENGNLAKRDYVKCHHIDDSLKGEINRFEPQDQNFKKWKFEGKEKGNLFFGIFWTKDIKRNPRSYGTLQLYMVNESLMKGFYVRLKVTSDGTQFSEELMPVKFEWRRIG